MKLTKEQALAMTKEQVLAADYREVVDAYGSYDDVHVAFRAMFASMVEPWEARVREAYEAKHDMQDLVTLFARQPAILQTLIWNKLTSRGIDEISFAKFVHKHFARQILSLFGDPTPFDGQGIFRS